MAIDYTLHVGETIPQYNARIEAARAANTVSVPMTQPIIPTTAVTQQNVVQPQTVQPQTVQTQSIVPNQALGSGIDYTLHPGETIDAYNKRIADARAGTQNLPQYQDLIAQNKTPSITVPTSVKDSSISGATSLATLRSNVASVNTAMNPTTTYVIKSGDTLGAIAARNGTTVSALAALNGISNPDRIQAGAVLKLPGAQTAQTTNTAPNSTASTLANIKTSLQETLAALTTLKEKGVSSIPDGTDPVKYLNDLVANSGVPQPKIDGNVGTADGMVALYTNYMNYQQDRQTEIDKLMSQISGVQTGGMQQDAALQSGKGTSGYIGASHNALVTHIANQVAPIQNQVDSLTRQLGISADTFKTSVALAQQLQELNKPQIISNSQGIWEYHSDGTIKQLANFPKEVATPAATQTDKNAEAAANASKTLMDARGPDGYTDPNLYARIRSSSTLSAPEFDNRFGYLVNPLSTARLGIAGASTSSTSTDYGALAPADITKGMNWLLTNKASTSDIEKFKTDRGFQAWVMTQI